MNFSDYADSVLVSLEGKTMLVPAVWSLEIANVQDVQPVGEHVGNVVRLAHKYGLSAYDAAYLELSIRCGAPLATLDVKLQKAARQAGVALFTG